MLFISATSMERKALTAGLELEKWKIVKIMAI
jgi:hypothetical protein